MNCNNCELDQEPVIVSNLKVSKCRFYLQILNYLECSLTYLTAIPDVLE